jgi:hypothetical protein
MDSVMTNISAIEQYGKNVRTVEQQMLQMFQKLKQQTDTAGTWWKDEQYERFRQDFDQDIMKNVQEMAAKMELFANYIAKMCEIHRMAQQQKYY